MNRTNDWIYEEKDGENLFDADRRNKKILGKGGFGEVFNSRIILSYIAVNGTKKACFGGKCVSKCIDLSMKDYGGKDIIDMDRLEDCRKEAKFMRRLQNHPNIVKLIGCALNITQRIYAIAMEQADCSVYDFLKKNPRNLKGLPQNVFLDYIQDSINGLQFMHEKNIAHRDIKGLNMLVFSGPIEGRRCKYLFKYADFGLTHEGAGSFCGSLNEMSPSLIANVSSIDNNHGMRPATHTIDVDYWALAITWIYAAINKYSFECDTISDKKACINSEYFPKGAVGATVNPAWNSSSSERDRFHYQYSIDNQHFSKWFLHCFTVMVADAFYEYKSDKSLRQLMLIKFVNMTTKLTCAVESNIILLEPPSTMKYVQHVACPDDAAFLKGYPTLTSILRIAAEDCAKYIAISDDDIIQFSNDFRPVPGKTYVIVKITDEPWSLKQHAADVFKLVNQNDPVELVAKASYLLVEGDKLCSLMMEVVTTVLNKISNMKRHLKYKALVEKSKLHDAINQELLGIHRKLTKSEGETRSNGTTLTLSNSIETLASYDNELDRVAAAIKSINFRHQEISEMNDTLTEILAEQRSEQDLERRLEFQNRKQILEQVLLEKDTYIEELLKDCADTAQIRQQLSFNREARRQHLLELLKACEDRREKLTDQLLKILSGEDGLYKNLLNLTTIHENMEAEYIKVADIDNVISKEVKHIVEDLLKIPERRVAEKSAAILSQLRKANAASKKTVVD